MISLKIISLFILFGSEVADRSAAIWTNSSSLVEAINILESQKEQKECCFTAQHIKSGSGLFYTPLFRTIDIFDSLSS